MEQRRRLLVLTDISTLDSAHGEPDDTQSLVRLMLYTNDIRLEGLVATYTPHTGGVNPDFLRAVVRAYGVVRENLSRHDPRYPPAEDLLERIAAGSAAAGLDQVGEGKDTSGSELILDRADASDRPLWIAAWGGVTELAQALYRARASRSDADYQRLVSKLRVYAIGDQYDDCGPWIRQNHPGVFYIIARHAYRGMYRLGDTATCAPEWIWEHIKGKGALSDAYPVYNGGDAFGDFLGPTRGLKEGDTPSFLHLIDNGLCDPEHPEYGGWGGRFAREPGTNVFTDACDSVGEARDEWATVYRYRPDFQADFAARMGWCVQGADASARYPAVSLIGGGVRNASYGENLTLSARAEHPRGEALCFHWRYYPEAGTYSGRVLLRDADSRSCTVRLPRGGSCGPATAHFVLEVRTQRQPHLTAYRRVVVNVRP